MFSYRKRGRNWYVRGTVKVGRASRYVEEHSTGCSEQEAAEEYGDALAAEIREELLYGRRRRPANLTFAHVGAAYLERDTPHHPNDIWRIGELNEVMGDFAVADAGEAWAAFRRTRCGERTVTTPTGRTRVVPALDPATIDRFRDTAQAAYNHAAGVFGFEPPHLPRVVRGRLKREKDNRVRWLTIEHADLLVDSYAGRAIHVRPVMRFFRYQGARTQEALQLDWTAVDLTRRTAFVDPGKTGLARTLHLHDRVVADLEALWRAQNRPTSGRVFLNRLGQPYADTRTYALPGGNPLRSAHDTALGKAVAAGLRPNGGPDFHVHDWRHHWASWCVMVGIDLETIRRQGGWQTLRMVERYAAVGEDHMAAAVNRLR